MSSATSLTDAFLPVTLGELQRRYPLAETWSLPLVFSDTTTIRGVSILLAGLTTQSTAGESAIGSAADFHRSPLARAYFELVERVAVAGCVNERRGDGWRLKTASGAEVGAADADCVFPVAPDGARWRYARSNGVAAGASWDAACRRAAWELSERDRLLRSWFGELIPRRVILPANLVPEAFREVYEFEGYHFRDPTEPEVSVAALYGFPARQGVPLVSGAGARATLHEALSVAARECMQGLGFLWGEDIPEKEPAFEPEPGYHQEFFLWPGARSTLRGWLSGEHERFSGVLQCARSRRRQTLFVDLTPAGLAGRLFVAKAVDPSRMPLTFGCGHPNARSPLPDPLRVHPIA